LTIKIRTHAIATTGFCVPAVSRESFSAHCVCVVGKNYRLQDIQLSKIIRGKNPSESVECPRDFSPGPLAHVARGAPSPRSASFAGTPYLTPSGSPVARADGGTIGEAP